MSRGLQDRVTRQQWSHASFSSASEHVIGTASSATEHSIYIWDLHGHLAAMLNGPKDGAQHFACHPTRPILVTSPTASPLPPDATPHRIHLTTPRSYPSLPSTPHPLTGPSRAPHRPLTTHYRHAVPVPASSTSGQSVSQRIGALLLQISRSLTPNPPPSSHPTPSSHPHPNSHP